MPGAYETQTMKRLMEINWRIHTTDRVNSSLALFNEYLRRVGLWCIELAWDDAHPVMSDLPNRINPDVMAVPVNTTLIQQTMRTIGRTSVFERMMVTRALNMAAVRDANGGEFPLPLPDPYEPLMGFYERGGWVEKGTITGGLWSICGTPYTFQAAITYADMPPHNLTAAALDKLDG